MDNLIEILSDIQQKLKAPKGQTNNFGKYKYRSCEDIVEAVKPLLADHNAVLLLGDELENIGDRYYIKATAGIMTGKDRIETYAYAREALDRKGMDVSQITGTASSYARKYALNGLFAIDDTKDADSETVSKEPSHRFKAGEKDKIIEGVRTCLADGDAMGIQQIFAEYDGEDPEEKMKVWALFNSTERATIKELLK